jgi:hypothetical protein
LKRCARISIFILVIVVFCAACKSGRVEIDTGTQSSQETAVLSAIEESPIPVSETPVAPAGTSSISPPMLERPGLKIVYTVEGNLYFWTVDGKTQLTSSGDAYSPRISPDGQVIAFLRPVDEYHLELWAIDTDGTNERRLVGVADLDVIGGGARDQNAVAINPYHYTWVPGFSTPGKKPAHILAFNTQQVFQGPGLSLLDDLHLVNADTMEIKYLLLSGWGGEFTFSPDGSQIAITNLNSISLCQADASNYRNVLTYEPVNSYSEYRFYADPVWSPDNAFLRVAIPPEDPLAETPLPTGIWIIPTNGEPVSQVGSVMAVPFFEQPVVFSPDLSRIIYFREAGLPAENRRELHLAAYDGSDDRMYMDGSLVHFLEWATDSIRFSYNVGESQEAWIGDSEASPVLFPLDPVGIIDVRWLDARNFLYLQQKTDGFEFYLADLNRGAILIDSIGGEPPVYDIAYP